MTSPSDSESSLRLYVRVLRLVFESGRWLGGAVVATSLATALCPFLLIFAVGSAADVITTMIDHDGNVASPRVIATSATIMVLVAAQYLLGQLGGLLSQKVVRRVDDHTSQQVAAALLRPVTVDHLENPSVKNDVTAALGLHVGSRTPGGAAAAVGPLLTNFLQTAGCAVLLIRFEWWLGCVLLIVWTLIGRWSRRQYIEAIQSVNRQTQDFREGLYLFNIAVTRDTSKEVRIFGLERWLRDRFRRELSKIFEQAWARRRALTFTAAGSAVVVLLITGAAVLILTTSATNGTISLGDLLVYTQALVLLSATATATAVTFDAEYARTALPALERILEIEADALARTAFAGPTRSLAPSREIRVDNVTFRYEGGRREVIRGLDLALEVGHSTAVVGVNGAGKTTLAKLLAGLLLPTDGDLLVDGAPLTPDDIRAWQRQVAIVFQDFAKYPLSVRDNIRFGSIESAPYEPVSAARRAGALQVIESMEWGWDSVLCRGFRRSVEPSGGQWQRIALARALQAVEGGARVLVLDEPTSHLDVAGEADFYDRFLEITSGLTTLLISHWFPSVRKADRICVLENGAITEQGTHEQLVGLGGTYQHMFAVQAEAFS